MKLYRVEPSGFDRFQNRVVVGVYKHADVLNVLRNLRDNTCRRQRIDISRTFLIKVKSQHVRTALRRMQSVRQVRDAAYLYLRHRLWFALSARSAFVGSSLFIKASPIRKPPKPRSLSS